MNFELWTPTSSNFAGKPSEIHQERKPGGFGFSAVVDGASYIYHHLPVSHHQSN